MAILKFQIYFLAVRARAAVKSRKILSRTLGDRWLARGTCPHQQGYASVGQLRKSRLVVIRKPWETMSRQV